MDSLTQIALGACVAAACVPQGDRRKAAALGAALGTLPDLDVFVPQSDPVAGFTMHRGFSHSLVVLAVFAFALWAVLRLGWRPVREAPRRWLAGIMLALLTHPLLDAHTAYGTQLFWPAGWIPVSWATIFVIDPLYTVPLLAGLLAILIRPTSQTAGRLLVAGLALSTLYLGWTWTAKSIVTANARKTLETRGLADARIFVTPTPLNSLLWRVVVRTENGHLEGVDSVVADDGPIEFTFHPSDDAALAAAADIPAVARLSWFADGFVGASMEGDTLILSDLRMGQHPDYVFRHTVATRGNPHWHEIEPQRLSTTVRTRDLSKIWQRIWRPTSDL
ncbi:MAG: metal-dependent hydrolase [Chthoniobacterales bacterium]